LVKCPKCGARVREDYDFCPKCGAALKPAPPPAAPAPPPAPPYRAEKYEKREKGEKEKREKREKGEKAEKGEKYERRELNYLAPLVGGLVLVCLGLMLYMTTHLTISPQIWVALFFIIIGVIVLIAGVYAITIMRQRSPQP